MSLLRSRRAHAAAPATRSDDDDDDQSEDLMDAMDVSDDDQTPRRGGGGGGGRNAAAATAAAATAKRGRGRPSLRDVAARKAAAAAAAPQRRGRRAAEEDDDDDMVDDDDDDRVRDWGRGGGGGDGASSSGDDDDDDDGDGAPARNKAAAATTTKARGRPRGGGAGGAKAVGGARAQTSIAALLPAELDEGVLRDAWLRLPQKNRNHKDALMARHRADFARWRLRLRQRFSLLLHGAGSKRALLEAFASEALADGGVLAVRGLSPGVTARGVLSAVAGALAARSARSAGADELLAAIMAEPAARRLYVIVHNIDGPGLRAPEEQLWLGRLAACPCVHLIASVDHANAGLLWDARAAAAFRWAWVEAPTFAAYADEARDVPPLLAGCLQSSSKRGAAAVLPTLVPAARSVFRVLAERQLDDPEAGGVTQALLFRLCRERFVLNSEQALRSHLVEFRDHELVRGRPAPGGGELLYVPLDPDVLRSVLDEMGAAAPQ